MKNSTYIQVAFVPPGMMGGTPGVVSSRSTFPKMFNQTIKHIKLLSTFSLTSSSAIAAQRKRLEGLREA